MLFVNYAIKGRLKGQFCSKNLGSSDFHSVNKLPCFLSVEDSLPNSLLQTAAIVLSAFSSVPVNTQEPVNANLCKKADAQS